MTGNFKKLIDAVQVDIVLIDMLYQWANTPTGITAVGKSWIPDHRLIAKNLQNRYTFDKERANSYLENFKKLVEEAGFDFNSGYLDATWLVNEYLNSHPGLKDETLFKLASATPKERQILWLYCKFKDQWLQYALGSDFDDNRENSKQSFKKFGETLKIMFNYDPTPNRYEIVRVLLQMGFINELESISTINNKHRPYIFSSYLENVAKNIDTYVNIKDAI